jgi:hypothetical protein
MPTTIARETPRSGPSPGPSEGETDKRRSTNAACSVVARDGGGPPLKRDHETDVAAVRREVRLACIDRQTPARP